MSFSAAMTTSRRRWLRLSLSLWMAPRSEVDRQRRVGSDETLLAQVAPKVMRNLGFERGVVLIDTIRSTRAGNDGGGSRMRERELQRGGLDWDPVSLSQRLDLCH